MKQKNTPSKVDNIKKFGASFLAMIMVLTTMTTIFGFAAAPAEAIAVCNGPVADANGPYFGYTNTPVTVDGSGSHDPDGTIELYEWDWDFDGTYDSSSVNPTMDHTFTIGTHDIQLRVTDNVGCTGTDATTVLIVQDNPELGSSCGIDIALVLDSSGSIDTGELSQMKTAYLAFVDAFLPRTPTMMSVTEFDDTAWVSQAFTSNIANIKSAINGATSGGCTNWEDALLTAYGTFDPRVDKPDLLIFASDGNPNTIVSSTSGCDTDTETAVAAAIDAANTIKAAGIQIITLGIGSDLNPDSLIAISSEDKFYQSGFDTLADTLADLAAELCGGTVTVRKFVDRIPMDNWEFTATVTGGTANPASGFTDADGFIVFDIELADGIDEAIVTITETLQPGYTFENATAWGCDGGRVGTPGDKKISDIPVGPECAVYAEFNNSEHSDDTPPIQTLEFGRPNITRLWLENEYYVIGPCTPVWINSSDNESGSDRIEYSVWVSEDVFAMPVTWTELPQYRATVYDEDDGVDDGIVHVEFYLDETCFHEIRYQCWDEEGNTEGLFSEDFFVDKCPPVVEKEVGCPQYGVGIIQPPWATTATPLVFSTYDECCLPGGTGVKSLTIKVWWKENTCDDSGAMNLIDTIYIEDGAIGEKDPRDLFVGYEYHFPQSGWYELEYYAEDIMCNVGLATKQQHRVDVEPPHINKTHPDHGYMRINDTHGYLKAGAEITLEAHDMPNDTCNVGMQNLFWRWEYNDTMYPQPGDPDAVDGATILVPYCTEDPEVDNYWWYIYTDPITFNEECIHDLYYFGKDLLGNHKVHHQVYFVDDTEPYMEVTYPGHGYYEGDEFDHLKINTAITLDAFDNPDHLCQTGIESIFYRYEWDGTSYPIGLDPGIVHGTDLVAAYGADYDIPEITDYYWIRVDDATTDVSFSEECQHDLYFFAKDNVCHRSEIYNLRFYVDGSKPQLTVGYPEHGYYREYIDQIDAPPLIKDHLKCNTTFRYGANDKPYNDCAAGIESMFWRYQWNDTLYPSAAGDGIVHGTELVASYGSDYDITQITDYYWYRVDDDHIDMNFMEECSHDVYWFAKDNVCQRTDIAYNHYYVDNTPPEITVEFEDAHGYYQDDMFRDHIKCGMQFKLTAHDLPDTECMAGIESIFWRYEWNGTSYPEVADPGCNFINGTDLVDLYGSDYDLPAITDYVWYRIDNDEMFIHFNNECQHNVYYFAKDNVCHRSNLKLVDIYVDCSEPDVWLEFPGHGYYPIDADSGYLKAGSATFTINASDNPDNECAVGIESVFWRYEYNGQDYPPAGPDMGVVSGDYLAAQYGYTDPNITENWWYFTDSSMVSIVFPFACQHDMYYFAKDNVCHRTEVKEHTFFVDDLPPLVEDLPPMVSHGYYYDDNNFGRHLKCGLPIHISATDQPIGTPCAAGVESIFWRYEYEGRYYPEAWEEGAIDGATLVDLYGCAYDVAEITDFWWYRVDEVTANVIFEDECNHTLIYFAKDNVCQRSDIFESTWYIDCTGPDVELEVAIEHGVVQLDETHYNIKTDKDIYLYANDLPEGDCGAGIESLFWRYEWNDSQIPGAPGPNTVSGWYLVEHYGEAYNITAITDYYWYRINDDLKSLSFDEACQHDLYFFAKDNVCNRGDIFHYTFYVDNEPPEVTIEYPDHGYYQKMVPGADALYYDYLKCFTDITLNATDYPQNDCGSGIESIFWRYEWNDTKFPASSGEGIIHGSDLVDMYGSMYNVDCITEYWWYRVNDSTVDIHFEEECYHELFFFAKDNLCQRTQIYSEDYFVDNSDPYVGVEFPDHGYYPITENSGYLKCNTSVELEPEDLPDNECAAGIENIFWRYEYDGNMYPSAEGVGVIHGSELTALYGYTEQEIVDFFWYLDEKDKNVRFMEECQHELYFFAKDNVCHHSEIYHHTYYVDNTPPLLELNLPDHGYHEIDEVSGYLKGFESIWINATDFGSCQAGIESIFWRYQWDDGFYPPNDIPANVVHGTDLVVLYGDAYDIPAINQYYWYRVDADSVEIWFEEECEHELFWFAKDNVCHPTDIQSHTFFVDDSNPEIYDAPPCMHGSYDGKYIKCGIPILLYGWDNPENECAAGVESIFYRYTWDGQEFPSAAGTGIVHGTDLVAAYGADYDTTEITDYYWYRVDDDQTNVTFAEECEHDLYYFMKDNVCHRSEITNAAYYVDCSGPTLEFEYPDHGYVEINEASSYIKANIGIKITAHDMPVEENCQSGIEAIFYRYEFNGTSYPQEGDISAVNGSQLTIDYGYTEPEIVDYWWYLTDSNQTEIGFNEECQHDLYVWAKDNVCNHGTITHHTYYVDEFPPQISKEHGEGYVYVNENHWIRCGVPIWINATDDGECDAGVESIFYRYEFDGDFYPDGPGAGIVNGEDLIAMYGDDYDKDEIKEYYWYREDDDSVMLSFGEDCIHDLYYFGKDNVCHPTMVFEQQYHVDCTPPETTKDVSDPVCVADEDDIALFNLTAEEAEVFWIRDNDTEITLTAEDFEEPCASGINYMHIELWWDENNNLIFEEGEQLWEHEIDGTSYTFKIYQDCLHKIVWYSVDLVGNEERPHIQYHRVDSTPPNSTKTFNGSTYPAENYPNEMYGPDMGENYWVTSDTEITLTAVDETWPCASGVVGFHVKVEYDPDCDGTFEKLLFDDDIPSPYEISFTFKELLDAYYGYTYDCYEGEYKIYWSAFDCLGNTEEEKIQYHRVDDTPPHVIILKPTDGWYADGECIPTVVLAEDLNSPHCGNPQCDVVGIEDGKQGYAYVIDIFPEFKCIELDSTNFLYDEDSHEFIGNVCIPEESGIEDGIVIFVAGAEDNLGNDWDSIREMIHAVIIQALGECMDECCIIELITDLWADFVIDQNLVFVGIDNTPPEVEIIDTQVELGSIYVKANATDVLSGIVTGTPCYITLGGVEIGTLPYSSALGGCQGTLPTAGAPDGEQTLTVCVSDRAGSTGCDSVLVDMIELPGPTTSGTDVIPEASVIETELTAIATVHSTIAEVVDAEYFISQNGTKGPSGTGTPLNPVDGLWDGTTEDITAQIDTTGWPAGEYTIYVHGLDNHGRWGAYDEEEFTLVLEHAWRPVVCNILEPEDGDEFTVECGSRYVEVIVDAYRPPYEGLPMDWDLDVVIWLDQPYGAPDLYYPVTWDDGDKEFTAEIPVYMYSTGSELNLEAKAEDDGGNRAYDDVTFSVITTIEYDLWMKEGWNGPINIAVLGCDDSVESVFASIDGSYDWIFEVGTWKNYHYGEGGNTLHTIEPDGWYWVKMNEAARFYVDNNPPTLWITDPSCEYEERCEGPDSLDFETCELETWVTDVHTQIYDETTEHYYNGTTWVDDPVWLECMLDCMDMNGYADWYYDTTGIWTKGHTYNISAYAVDAGGCSSPMDYATIHIYKPEILVEKTANDEQELEIDTGSEFTFEIHVENAGDLTFNDIDVYDYLPDGVGYQNSATVAYNGGAASAYVPDVDGNEIYFNLDALAPAEYADIEFTANITSCETLEENLVEVYAYSICDDEYDDDTASVYGICGEPGDCDPDHTWTTTADFNGGTPVSISTENDQLELLLDEVTTYPTLWIANAGEDSLSKFDTNTNKELARYHTWFGPLGNHGPWEESAPSRTCVDSDGNCYVANRDFTSYTPDVFKVLTDDWIDRNGDGFLNTSYDEDGNGEIEPDEMLPMTDLNSNGIIDDEEIVDERIAWVAQVGSGGRGRSLAIGLDGHIWLGLYDSQQYYKIDSDDGSVLGGPYSVSGHRPYGALVDKYGYLWGSNGGSNLLKMNTSNPADYSVFSVSIYGLALGYDSLGNTLVYCGYNYPFRVFNSSTETFSDPIDSFVQTLGVSVDSQGNIAVGAWSSNQGDVAKYAPDTTIIWQKSAQVSSEIRGIVFDSNDNIWAIHREASKLSKFDGTDGTYLGVYNTGLYPYTYSDATGVGFAGSVSAGTWRDVFDSGAADTAWNAVTWTEFVPGNTSVEIDVRSSNDEALWSPWESASNGGDLTTTPDGRYIEVRVTLKSSTGIDAPIVYDITVEGTCAYQPPEDCDPDRTYTDNSDFDEGALNGVEYDSVPDQLQVVLEEVTTYPVLWIANSGDPSVSKWDTQENKELARYQTFFGTLGSYGSHDGPAPSRTCVDVDGNCYVANRQFPSNKPADVIKILADDFIDRNGNGVMDTSYDANADGVISPSEMMPIVDTNSNNKIDDDEIQDERIAWVVEVGSNNGLGRSLSIDLDGNLWVGLYNAQQYYKISGVDGSILAGPISTPGHTPYGSLVDKHGILWGASLTTNMLRLDTNNVSDIEIFTHSAYGGNYGIGLGYDEFDNTQVYLGSWGGYSYIQFDSATETFSTPAASKFTVRGLSVDKDGNILCGSGGGGPGSGGVAKFAPDGSLIWSAASQVGATEARGTVVDSDNNVWCVHVSAHKISKFSGVDGSPLGAFDSGKNPYTYSDATGLGLRSSIAAGSWDVIHDSQAPDTQWNSVSWNSNEPEDTSITVKVRSSNDKAAWSPWEEVTSGDPITSTPDGQYLNVVASFRSTTNVSPILYDLSIDGTCAGGDPEPEPEPGLEFFKEIDMPDSGDFVEQDVGDKVRFWLKVHNTGDINLNNIIVVDELPDGLTYDNVTGPTFSATGLDPATVITTYDNVTLTFDFGSYELPPMTWIHIYFFAYVDEEGEHENWADVTAYYTCCDYLSEEDNATAIGIIEEPESFDFGDAPDPMYPTLLASDGARHGGVMVSAPYMGVGVDPDADGQPTVGADGDDNDGNDDEDGVVFNLNYAGELSYVDIDMFWTPFPGYLNAWVDFNQDGDWDDADEQIFTDEYLTNGTVHYNLSFVVPSLALPGDTYARFRISSEQGLLPTGAASDGEVEDYKITFEEPPCEPMWDVTKETWCYDLQEWSYQGMARDPDNHGKFRIIFNNTGACPITNFQIRDELPMTLVLDTYSVIHGGLAYTVYYDAISNIIYFNFTGTLNPGEEVIVENEADFVGDECQDTSDTNWAFGQPEGLMSISASSDIYYWCVD